MSRKLLKLGAGVALLLASATAYADDPTGVLERERGTLPGSSAHAPRFSDVGPCQRGTQSEPFPNGQGYRCVHR